MNTEKIKIFASLPKSELTKVSGNPEPETTNSQAASIESEFRDTNLHTKDTGGNAFNTASGQTDIPGSSELSENIESSESSKVSKGTRLGKILPAKVALTMIDKLLPSTIVLLLHYFNLKLEKKKLQLTKDEINEIAPAVQDCLNDIQLNFDNPWIALGFILSITYGSKIIDAIPEIEKATPKKDKPKNTHEAIEMIAEENEVVVKESNIEKFEKVYNQYVDEIKNTRKRGVLDAMDYLATMYPEKIKTLMKTFEVTDMKYLNFRHNPKKRKRKSTTNDVNNQDNNDVENFEL